MDFLKLAPQLVLVVFILFFVIAELVFKRKIVLAWFAVGGFTIALLFLIFGNYPFNSMLFSGEVAGDGFAYFFQLFFLVVGIVISFFSFNSAEIGKDLGGEYFALITTAVLGMFYMASSTNFLMLYLSMEMVSLSSYLLAGYTRNDKYSAESALKYLVFGATASGVMIMGIAYLFGLTGSLNFSVIHGELSSGVFSSFTLLAIVFMIFTGFFFKMSLVPFHMWAPDVYEGAPTPIAAFLAVGSKAAGFAMAMRFLYTVMIQGSPLVAGVLSDVYKFIPVNNLDWPLFLGIISVLTMTVGNITALNQTSVKRLLAYSSIAHAGYMLMGFAAMNYIGFYAVMFYFVIYLLMNIGAFLFVQIIYNKIGTDSIVKYRGLGRRSPFAAVMMGIFLFSLAGIPPLGGFIGKFYLFVSVIKAKLFWLAVIGIANSVLSLYYYARIAKMMFLEDSNETEKVPVAPAHIFLLIVLGFPVVILGVYWAPVLEFVKNYSHLFLP